MKTLFLLSAFVYACVTIPTNKQSRGFIPGTCQNGEAVSKTGYKLGSSDVLHECQVHPPPCSGCIARTINCSTIVQTNGVAPEFFQCLCCPGVDEMSKCLFCKQTEEFSPSAVGK